MNVNELSNHLEGTDILLNWRLRRISVDIGLSGGGALAGDALPRL